MDSLPVKSAKPPKGNDIDAKTSDEEEETDDVDTDDEYEDNDEKEEVDAEKQTTGEKEKKNYVENGFSGNEMDVSYSLPTRDDHPRVNHSLQTFPRNSRNKMQSLMKFIQTHAGDEISWDRRGLVTINGRELKHSNIIDLVREVTVIRPKSSHSFSQPPPGFGVFSKVLKRATDE